MEQSDQNLFVAPRTYTADEQKQIQGTTIGQNSIKFKQAPIVASEAEKTLQANLNSMFEIEEEAEKKDEEMAEEAPAAEQEGEVDDDLFADSDQDGNERVSEDPIF